MQRNSYKLKNSDPPSFMYASLKRPTGIWVTLFLVLCLVSVQPIHQVYAGEYSSEDDNNAHVSSSNNDSTSGDESLFVPKKSLDEESMDLARDTDTEETVLSDDGDESYGKNDSDMGVSKDEEKKVKDSGLDIKKDVISYNATGTETLLSDYYDTQEAKLATGSDSSVEYNDYATSTVASVSTSTVLSSDTESSISAELSNDDGIHTATSTSDSEENEYKEEGIHDQDLSEHSGSSQTDDNRNLTTDIGYTSIEQSAKSDTPDTVSSLDTKIEYSNVTNSQNRHQFSERECIMVAENAYYCQRIETVQSDELYTDVVFSKITESGYKDIFLRTTRDTLNITQSTYNDISPYYDPVSESVVWHRELNGRYQIMSYDIREGQVKQLTDTRTNNMEPTRSGNITVWQRWVDDRWQIIIMDDNGEKQLTNDSVHNLAPYVRGNHVIWNTYTVSGDPRVAVFDMYTEYISYIDGSEEGRVGNPRFVLVYDTLLSSGDKITQEFDPATGKTRPIAHVPVVPLPDIPSPDPVGEVRALQNKNDEDDTDFLINPDDQNDNSKLKSSTTLQFNDIDMSPPATTTVLSEYDLVIPTYATTTRNASSTMSSSTKVAHSATSTDGI